MISKRAGKDRKRDNYAALADYIAAGGDREKCLMAWCAGCIDDEDYRASIGEVLETQAANTRSEKTKIYHLIISFRAKDEAQLTPEILREIEMRFAMLLGYGEHQRHCGVHKDTANMHMHIAYNMIHPEKLHRHVPPWDYWTRDKLCREIERDYGLVIDKGRSSKRQKTLQEGAANLEAHTGQESFESYAKSHRAALMEALKNTESWQDIHETLAALGLEIKPSGNGFAIKDRHGKHAVKASTVDRSLSKTKLENRLGSFRVPANVDRVPEKTRYTAEPVQSGPGKARLSAIFRDGIRLRVSKLKDVKAREDGQIAAVRYQWARKRKEIEQMSILKPNRLRLLALAKKHEAEAVAAIRATFKPERQAVREEIPFKNWKEFLQREAELGDETALAILRSKEKEAELDSAPEPEQKPKKDWSRHAQEQNAQAQEQTEKAAIRAEYTAKERELMEREDVSAKGKKPLLAFLRMEQIAAEAQAEGKQIGEIKRRIDGKGTVIFTLASGGRVRDSGREVVFTPQDENSAELAARYARKKWGKNIHLDGNSIRFVKPKEVEKNREQQKARSAGPSL